MNKAYEDHLLQQLEFCEGMIRWHRNSLNWHEDMLKTEKDALARSIKERDEIIEKLEKERRQT